MNIGVFTDTYEPVSNGVVDAVWRLCKGFKKAGHKVHLFALSDKNADEEREGIKVHKFKGKPFKFYPDFLIRYKLPIKRVNRIVRKERIKVFHSNLHMCMGLTALIISMRKKIPMITTFHTMVPQFIETFFKAWEDGSVKEPSFVKFLGKIGLKKPIQYIAKKIIWYWMRYFNTAEWMIVPSEYTKKILIKHGLKKEKIIVIPNPIKHSPQKKVQKSKNLILHVGRLSAEKKVNVFIKSLKYVKSDFHAIITSKGPLREYLEKLAEKEGLSDKITFTGFIPRKELEDYYDKATIFVSAAEHDTFNNCVAEALVHEIPVIINQNSGATDFVKHNKNGLIIKNDNPKEYAKQIDWLLFNEGVRKALSNAAKQIREYTNVDNIIKKIENILEQAQINSTFRKIKDFSIYLLSSFIAYSFIIIGTIFEKG